jgi:hypothetical protein
MKKILYILTVLILIQGCSADKNIKKIKSDKIDITIEQDGNVIDIIDDTAEIRRTKFSFKIKFLQPESLLVNASFKSETFNNAKEGLPLADLSGFKNTGIAEDLFNRESAIYLSKDSPNFWYYSDDLDHRFTSVLKTEDGYICSRDVSCIIDLDGTGEKTDLIKIKEKAIYLVLIKIEWNESFSKMIEKSRKVIKLKFLI